MSGISGILGRVRKCGKIFTLLNKPRVQSIVYMNSEGEILWEEGVEYNPTGVLVVPQRMTLEEWESANIRAELRQIDSGPTK
jgi:hypothetical protein